MKGTYLVTLTRTEVYMVVAESHEDAITQARDAWHLEDDPPDVIDVSVDTSRAIDDPPKREH